MKLILSLILIAFTAAAQTPAPQSCASRSTTAGSWDTSGNGLLSGAYNFRYVQYSVGDQAGDLSHAAALFGTVTFDGNGKYSITASDLDSNSIPLAATSVSFSGFYSISACGLGFISNPLSPGNNPPSSTDLVWGLVSEYGVFIGSTTETQNPFNDLFIGAPATPSAGNSTLKGAYSVAYMNFPDGYFGDSVAAGFQMDPDGAGHIGSANILMYQAGSGTAAGVVEPVNYSFGGGIGTLTFPIYGQAISRSKYLYVSPDGNLIFGGGADAFDIFVGVRTLTTTTPVNGFAPGFAASGFNGLYYQAGLDEIVTSGTNPSGSLQSWYGAFQVRGGTILDHQRIVAPLISPLEGPAITPRLPGSYPYQPFDYTSVDSYSLAFGSDLGYTDTATGKQYVFGENGDSRLGFGVYPKLGINIALRAPALPTTPPSPVYINPTGVVNAAGNAPYTSGIAPGEMITLYGSNLASATSPTTVTINSETATIVGSPLPGQVSVIVPSDITGPYALIQVSNTSASNIVSAFVNKTALGIFTQAQNGLGDADALNSSSALVTLANPVVPGGTLAIPVTGLGNGSSAPGIASIFGSTTSTPTSSITVAIGGVAAPITSISSSPGSSSISIVTVTVPASLPAEDATITISGLDSTTAQATVEVK